MRRPRDNPLFDPSIRFVLEAMEDGYRHHSAFDLDAYAWCKAEEEVVGRLLDAMHDIGEQREKIQEANAWFWEDPTLE